MSHMDDTIRGHLLQCTYSMTVNKTDPIQIFSFNTAQDGQSDGQIRNALYHNLSISYTIALVAKKQ